MRKELKLICLIISLAVMVSCVPFRDSPFSDTLTRGERDLNSVNLKKVGQADNDGVVRIALLSDSHGNYEDLERVVAEINQTAGVDFAIHLGDLTNSSYNYEYDQFLEVYSRLRVPTFTLIGNHDALGAGPSLFRKAFGPSNYFFETQGLRLIFWHSVGLEDPDGFDLPWLFRTVNESQKPILIFSHVPLDDPERFHGSDRDSLIGIINHPKVQSVFNGHNHGYDLKTPAGTRRMTVPRVEHNQWVLLEFQSSGFSVERNQPTGATWVDFKPSI